jgi:small GTP-binding protein
MKANEVVLVGETSVSKTCIVDVLCRDSIDPLVKPTLGATYSTKKMVCDGQELTRLIWDTAGQERFRMLTPMYFRGAKPVVVVYSIAPQISFGEVDFWVQTVRANLGNSVPIVIVGNKSDLVEVREVDSAAGQRKAGQYNAMFFETSAATGACINDVFLAVASAIIHRPQDMETRETAQLVEMRRGTKEKECC